MEARKCDRCGKYFTFQTHPDPWEYSLYKTAKKVTKEKTTYGFTLRLPRDIDLCDECHERFDKMAKEFLNMEE